MHTPTQHVLISGASFAGLSTAHWLCRMGYQVTIVEVAPGIRQGGTAVDIKDNTVDIVRRMGLLDQIRARRLNLKRWEIKNAHDATEHTLTLRQQGEPPSEDAFEIERDVLLHLLFDTVKDRVKFVFGDSITQMRPSEGSVAVTFAKGPPGTFDLVLGCDGVRSLVRKLVFGEPSQYLHFLGQYFSITIVDKLLIERDTAQMYNEPGRAVMLNAYKNKTDIIFSFASDDDVPYNVNDRTQQKHIIAARFKGRSWRCAELLEETQGSDNFYFDKLQQVRMPTWTRGRVALIGDAGYCPSPAAGMGGSIAIDGAAALADALRFHDGDFSAAFPAYEQKLRPFVDHVQIEAVRVGLETLVPRTQQAIDARNQQLSAGF